MEVDILIPTYNRQATILQSINSALNQKKVKVNVVVIENNSDDGTLELIRNYFKDELPNSLKVVAYDKTVDMHENWNRCFEHISSKYFKFLFSDDLLDPLFCFESIKIMEESPSINMVTSDFGYFTEDVDSIYKTRRYNKEGLHKNSDILFRSLITRNNIGAPSNSIFRSEICKKFKFENNRVATDWIYFAEILSVPSLSSFSYYSINKTLAYFRTSGSTETNKLKLTPDWIILNYNARIKMSKKFDNRLKRSIIRVSSYLYSIIVLFTIKYEGEIYSYETGKTFLKAKSKILFFVFSPIDLIMKNRRIRNKVSNV